MLTLLRLAIAGLILAATVFAQPIVLSGTVLNHGSFAWDGLPNQGIAPGSMFDIYGVGLGPANGVFQQSYPFPASAGLAGTSVQIAFGPQTVSCLMVYASQGQIVAVLPSSSPTGVGALTVTYNGQTSAPATVRVVASNFGILTARSTGSGLAIIQNYIAPGNTPINGYMESAQPGQTVTLWGTGLGAVQGDESVAPVVGNFFPQTDVYVGGVKARVSYAGRSGFYAGLDQIAFVVPSGVSGCNVPVAVRAGGVTSNFAWMSVAAGKVCTDPAGLGPDDFAKMQSAGSLGIGNVQVLRTIVRTGSTSATTDTATGAFYRYDPAGLSRSISHPTAPMLGSCTVYTFRGQNASVVDTLVPAALDAGPAMNISSGGVTRQAPRGQTGLYGGSLGGSSAQGGLTPFLNPGSFSMSGAGGADIGAMQASFTIPQPISWDNADAINTISRSQDLTINWSGASGANQYVTIVGTSLPGVSGAQFTCTAPATAGSFTVPSWVLSALPASSSLFSSGTAMLRVGVSPWGDSLKFSANGLDAGRLSYNISTMKTVVFQ